MNHAHVPKTAPRIRLGSYQTIDLPGYGIAVLPALPWPLPGWGVCLHCMRQGCLEHADSDEHDCSHRVCDVLKRFREIPL